MELRSKTKVLSYCNLSDLPEWNYDGSSTQQAQGNDSEIIIKPQYKCKHPFRENGYLVMCDTYYPNGKVHQTNNRVWAENCFSKNKVEKPWYGLEQEYFIINPKNNLPLGMNTAINQGQYYCSVGNENAHGRELAEMHLEACLKSGLTISGINAEVAPGQWEFQIGPVEGIEIGDQLWIARYILLLCAEKLNYNIDFNPKPIPGDWNGSGCHANFSTLSMREGTSSLTGLEVIENTLKKLEKEHISDIKYYGKDNELRMSGKHETAKYNEFSYGRGNRGCSIRIPNTTIKNKKGYFEDRRPSSNCDPYLVSALLYNNYLNQ